VLNCDSKFRFGLPSVISNLCSVDEWFGCIGLTLNAVLFMKIDLANLTPRYTPPAAKRLVTTPPTIKTIVRTLLPFEPLSLANRPDPDKLSVVFSGSGAPGGTTHLSVSKLYPFLQTWQTVSLVHV